LPETDYQSGHARRHLDKQQGLERLRVELLRRFLSLHDAFARLDHTVSRHRALSPQEFRLAMERLGVSPEDADEVFPTLDSSGSGGVTLSEFLHALVDVSPQALLWELRCRLLHTDIGPQNLKKALELVQWPQHGWLSRATKVKRRTLRMERSQSRAERLSSSTSSGAATREPSADGHQAACRTLGPADMPQGCGEGPQQPAAIAALGATASSWGRKRQSPYCLNRGDWLNFCTSIFLTLFEAEQLFARLAGGGDKGFVDLVVMFETLRTSVEPDVSLERFATKAVQRYGALDEAFAAFAERPDPDAKRIMRWPSFHRLAVALHVNDSNAMELWGVLVASLEVASPSAAAAARRATERAEEMGLVQAPRINSAAETAVVTEQAFLRELSLWEPGTALEALDSQLCERFGNLAEGQRALARRLANTRALSPQELEAKLRAAGIRHCDVARALSSVAGDGGSVSLDAAIEGMRAARHCRRIAGASRMPSAPAASRGSAAQTVRNETLQVWDTLRSVQRDLRQGRDGPTSSTSALQQPLSGSAVPPVTPEPGDPDNGQPGGQVLTRTPSLQSVDRQRFSKAIDGAVRSADNNHSKFVLHNAHRQVLRLEERWALPPSPGAAAGAGEASRGSRSSSKEVRRPRSAAGSTKSSSSVSHHPARGLAAGGC